MAETFTWNPSYGAAAARKPIIKTVQFGDGYMQRQPESINTNPQVWNLSFNNRDVSEADEIDDFLTARGGVENFKWTPPRSVTEGLFICMDWTRTVVVAGLDSISATFTEVFEVES